MNIRTYIDEDLPPENWQRIRDGMWKSAKIENLVIEKIEAGYRIVHRGRITKTQYELFSETTSAHVAYGLALGLAALVEKEERETQKRITKFELMMARASRQR